MTHNDNLLVTLMEECSEIQQATSKALRFGLDGISPTEQKSNKDLILQEYYELTAIMDMLIDDEVLPRYSSAKVTDIKTNKKEKVWNYQILSKNIGRIEE